MKKIITILAASGMFAACAGSGGAKTAKVECAKEAVKIKADSNLKPVKLITDGGSVDDQSFNNIIWDGVSDYVGTDDENYVIPSSTNPKDFQTIYKKALSDTQVLVVGGFQHLDALRAMCKDGFGENKGVIYIDGVVESGNINSITFKTAEASFYAGYLAAQYLSKHKEKFDVEGSKGLKVGMYGGNPIEPVIEFLSGFEQGVEYWNSKLEDKTNKVEIIELGKDSDSYFSMSFKQGEGKPISEKLVNAGADIIFPVAGPQTLDTLNVIEEKSAHTLVVGVDYDQVEKYAGEGHDDKFLTSVLKNMDVAATDAIKVALGELEDEKYAFGKVTYGTIENGLTGLAFSSNNKLDESDYNSAKANDEIAKAAKDAKVEVKRFKG